MPFKTASGDYTKTMTGRILDIDMPNGENTDSQFQDSHTLYEAALGHKTLGFAATVANGIQYVIYLIGVGILISPLIIVGFALFMEEEFMMGIIMFVLAGLFLLGILFGLLVKVGADSISAGMNLVNQDNG